MFETRREAFEEWFSHYGVLTSQSKYTLALSETRDKLAYYASNPIGGGAQNINASVYPEHSVYEFDDPVRLRNLFDDCTKQNVRDDGAMHTAVGWYAMWLRLMAPDQWKDVEEWPNDNERKKTMKNRGYDYDAVLGQLLSSSGHSANTHIDSAYLAAIRAKPFILLAGMSGTGKTRIVRQLARGCCPTGSDLAKDPDHPGNYECIPVRPNWHDSTGLMGYVSRIDGAKYVVTDFVRFLAKAWLYEEEGIPFFLCLDEMNLAPVEQYFAEYLSVIESRRVKDGKIVSDPLVRITDEGLLKAAIDVVYKGVEHETAEKFKAFFVSQGGIPIPSNFVVMGTVNMDETTCSFPHKVLDRAMTFELNEFDIDSGLESNPDTPLGSIKVENAKGTFTHGWQVYAEAKDFCDKIKPYLVSVNAVLNGTKFKFAYRTRDEVMAYCVERMKDGTALVAALDEATSMKVLSRVEGDEQIVKRTWLEKLQTAIADGLKALCAEGEEPPKKCADKLAEMHKRLVDTGFTSFWA